MAADGASGASASAARRLFASGRANAEVALLSSSMTAFPASSSDESSGSGGDLSDDDDLAVASVDAASLDEQIRALRERVGHLATDGTDHELVLGCERLTARKERCVAQAYANHAMNQRRARAVFKHACERARERFAARCARLQQAMDDELVRELQRLQNAKAGVTVSGRRRRGVRPSPAASASSLSASGGSSGAGATHSGLLSPPLSVASVQASAGPNAAAEDSWYYYDGASFPLPSSLFDGVLDSDADDAAMAMSPAELAHRVRYEEKKRLDALLARPRVFAPLDQKLVEADVEADLRAIQHAMLQRRQRISSVRVDQGSSSAADHGHAGDKRADARAPATTRRRRKKLVTPRFPVTTASTNAVPAKTDSAPDPSTPRPPVLSTPTRLRFNPQLLREGQEVAVYRHRRRPNSTANAASDSHLKTASVHTVADTFSVGDAKMDCVLSGVIAAVTSTHVFVLSVSGTFEPILVADWVAGLVALRAVGNEELQRRKRRRLQAK